MFDIDSLKEAQRLIYKRTLLHYANSVLNGDISFDRAVKTLHFDTMADIIHLEEDLTETIRYVCPLRESV